MVSSHYGLETRRGVLRLVVGGLSVGRAARVRGVNAKTAEVWVRLAGMSLAERTRAGTTWTPPVLPEHAGHGHRLSLTDRCRIEAGLGEGLSLRAIARRIGVAPSTVSRELCRARLGSWQGPWYSADAAEYHAAVRRARPKTPKLVGDPRLRGMVVDGLNHRLSPQQISGRLRRRFPDREEMRVSPETIYQALYVQGRGALRQELRVVKALRTGRTGRVPQSRLPRRSSRPWLDGARLADRPAEARDRAVPGHWEGDLVVGPDKSGLVTLVERATRFTLIGRLPGARDSTTVIEVMSRLVQGLPGALLKTITWDQGAEMAEHATFTVATGCRVFFCDPHSPWQRGSNENTNGLIRDFSPKGTNFNHLTDTQITDMQDVLNNRPRAIHDYATPTEKLNQHIKHVALTT